ncbi:MAG TPA: DNA-processing protein DprA [Dongiaceae bacterium]|jgi:DNA processing protein|nr:DNA-processing protein DprA [Dongiaceae bacterium]
MTSEQRELSENEQLEWLQLWRTENVGPVAFRQLLARFGSAREALRALPDFARRGGRAQPFTPYKREDAEREYAALRRIGGVLLPFCSASFPMGLRVLSDSPPLLNVLGRLDLLAQPMIALVGARNASANGRRLAETMAADLIKAGYAVVSGLARGIDTAAHRGALSAQDDARPEGTVAVVAGGIDIIYPPENEQLYQEISQRGLIVAEMGVGTQPTARNFPRRNRIISGLSLGVVVIEAALKSGSLITARFALEQGREVMAVPGSPLDPRCRGANKLIREKATLVEDAEQIIAEIEPMRDRTRFLEPDEQIRWEDIVPPSDSELDSWRRNILMQLSPSPVAVDELLRQCQCSSMILGTILLELELAGRLERHPGNRVSMIVDKIL